MTVRTKHYFLPPIPEIPVDGPIRLGSIVAHPKDIFDPVNDSPVYPSSCYERVYVSNSAPTTISLSKSTRKNWGLLAELPALVSGNIDGERGTEFKESWSFENLRTIWFKPSVNYVRQSLADTQLQLYIQDNQSWLGHTNLYMVNGIKIAYGASALSEIATSYGFSGAVGVDLSALGAPITVGPSAGLWNGLSLNTSSSFAEPVVFAFRLRRLKIKTLDEIEQSDYNKNAMLGREGSPVKTSVGIDTDGVEEDDATGADFGLLEGGEFLDDMDEDETKESLFSKST
ncbi:hypothetical protein F5Y08DRAFT_317548 [Xylaria arbuscula]|nr:hypothetical protein F5Y08DRAFT_317548 [Xylaria arbuscula]